MTETPRTDVWTPSATKQIKFHNQLLTACENCTCTFGDHELKYENNLPVQKCPTGSQRIKLNNFDAGEK